MEGDLERYIHAGGDVAFYWLDREVRRELADHPFEVCADVPAVGHNQLTRAGTFLYDGTEWDGLRVQLDLNPLTRSRHHEERLKQAVTLQKHLGTKDY